MSAAGVVLPAAAQRNVGVFNMSPVRVKLTRPGELEKIVARWKMSGWIDEDALEEHGPLDFTLSDEVESVVQAGYKFGADHDAISSVVMGTGNPDHVGENIETILGNPLPAAVMEKLRTVFSGIVDTEGDSG